MTAIWQNHSKHVLMFSHAGKPIYSRYGDVSSQSGVVSVASALLMKSVDLGDELRSIRISDCDVVIDTRGPLSFMAIIRTGENKSAIRELLRAIYNHVLFVLTSKVVHRLAERPNTDIRPMLNGTAGSMDNLIR